MKKILQNFKFNGLIFNVEQTSTHFGLCEYVGYPNFVSRNIFSEFSVFFIITFKHILQIILKGLYLVW